MAAGVRSMLALWIGGACSPSRKVFGRAHNLQAFRHGAVDLQAGPPNVANIESEKPSASKIQGN